MSSFDSRCAVLDAELRLRKRSKKQLKIKIKHTSKNIRLEEKEAKICKESALVMEYLIGKKYENVIGLFEKTVSSALREFFDDTYNFSLKVARRGDDISVEFMVTTGEYKHPKPVKMTQGRALAEIVGLIMRIILVKLDKTLPDFIILDEPLGGLNKAAQQKAGKFFNKLSKDFGIQLIIITQSLPFATECEDSLYIEK